MGKFLIAIINKGIVSKKKYNMYRYEVRNNRLLIATFTHRRIDGLAQCLRLAAIAVDEAYNKNDVDLLNEWDLSNIQYDND